MDPGRTLKLPCTPLTSVRHFEPVLSLSVQDADRLTTAFFDQVNIQKCKVKHF